MRTAWLWMVLTVLLALGFLGCGEDGETEVETPPEDGEGLVESADPVGEVRGAFLAVVRAVRRGDYDEVLGFYSMESLEFMRQAYADYPELGTLEEEIERSWSAHEEAFAKSFGEDDLKVLNLDPAQGTAEVHWRYPGTEGELENASFFRYVDGKWKLALDYGMSEQVQ